MSGKIQNLLEQANHSAAEDSSVNQAKRIFSDESAAKNYFLETKNRLRDLSNWSEKSTPSNYELFLETGEVPASKLIEAGKFIRIGVVGAGKYDWVRVIGVHEAEDEFVITVRPSFDPTDQSPDKTETSHFFKSEATNNFCLLRDDKSVAMYVVGLDEKANVREAGNPIEAARNVAAANLGYYLGFQKAMWTEFCARMLEIGE